MPAGGNPFSRQKLMTDWCAVETGYRNRVGQTVIGPAVEPRTGRDEIAGPGRQNLECRISDWRRPGPIAAAITAIARRHRRAFGASYPPPPAGPGDVLYLKLSDFSVCTTWGVRGKDLFLIGLCR